MNNYCDPLWANVKVLDSDYSDYGGKIVRWQDPGIAYPDCSSGCRYFEPIIEGGRPSADWGICGNKNSPRHGLLTWEHQAGYKCYEN
jgi:hypothetical protein